MKILLAGDTHMDTEHFEYLAETAAILGAEKIFVLGDFGAWEHTPNGVEFMDEVDLTSEITGIKTYFLDGNHDKTSLVVSKYGKMLDGEGFMICRSNLLYAPRGHRWTWGSKKFIALGGAYSTDKQTRLGWELAEEKKLYQFLNLYGVDMRGTTDVAYLPEFSFAGKYWFPEEEMSDEDMDKILIDKTPVDIMLTHDKPRSTHPKWNRKDIFECHPNQDRIQKAMTILTPKELFHGHLHYRYTDDVRCGDDDEHTVVTGLDCNSEASAGTGDREDSWYLLEI